MNKEGQGARRQEVGRVKEQPDRRRGSLVEGRAGEWPSEKQRGVGPEFTAQPHITY